MCLASLVLTQQIKTRSGVYLGHGSEELGERNFGLVSLKSILNRDMEAKGIVLPELSCWTAAELPPPELAKHRRKSGGRAPGVQSLPPPCLSISGLKQRGSPHAKQSP